MKICFNSFYLWEFSLPHTSKMAQNSSTAATTILRLVECLSTAWCH